jgi:hypothetical protein
MGAIFPVHHLLPDLELRIGDVRNSQIDHHHPSALLVLVLNRRWDLDIRRWHLVREEHAILLVVGCESSQHDIADSKPSGLATHRCVGLGLADAMDSVEPVFASAGDCGTWAPHMKDVLKLK